MPTAFRRTWFATLLLIVTATGVPLGTEAIRYRFTFPEPAHRWMQVEASFTALGSEPLELRMSRSSPGRYSLHDFAKNVYDVEIAGADGAAILPTRPDAHGWTVAGHGGSVTVRYKVYGDRLDGTYLAVDPTHAHINMPAAIMWARGLGDRPATLTFEPPEGVEWRLASQLFPGPTALELTAPNFQYLMDSPVEFGPGAIRQFTVGDRTVRVALHHPGGDAGLGALVEDVEKVVREQGEIFGEYPEYEPGHYTFLADALPYASGDAMEHRNSTVITSTGSVVADRQALLESVSHEFFHGWNVERIRPQSLEPFDFDRANMSGELWLGEGFTQYYGPLVLSRAGLMDLDRLLATLTGMVGSIAGDPAVEVRSAEQMSRMAVFTDGGRTTDRTNWSNTYISYYPFGGAIALALDLSLRERSGGRVTLDDYMRAMWRVHGTPGGSRPGYVDRPYTMADAEARLAEVSGDTGFARDFFARYIQGHEVADYARLLAQAGLVLRAADPGTASLGEVRLEDRGGIVRVASAPLAGSPLYEAGLDVDDEVRQLDGRPVRSVAEVRGIVSRRKPGESIPVVFVDRTGVAKTSAMTLAEDGSLDLLPAETAGGSPTAAQKAFRAAWLN